MEYLSKGVNRLISNWLDAGAYVAPVPQHFQGYHRCDHVAVLLQGKMSVLGRSMYVLLLVSSIVRGILILGLSPPGGPFPPVSGPCWACQSGQRPFEALPRVHKVILVMM